jgi:HSP20 family protein
MRKGLEQYRSQTPSIFNMFSDFDEMFERVLRSPWSLADTASTSTMPTEWFQPKVDVEETKDAFLLTVDLPGIRKEDVKIDLNGRTLTISGERKRETKSNEGGVKTFERSHGQFMRSFTLPENVNVENIEANLDHGVLELAIPKSEQAKPRSIEIGSGRTGTKQVQSSEKTETH